jgi:DNA-binding SARP family transcriptional activator
MVRLELLGGFRVVIGTMVVPDRMWRRRKDAALIKLLCLAPRHRLRRDQLMEYLWPDLAPNAAAANLRKSVHFVRHMYEGRYDTEPIVAEGDLLGLPVEHIWIDVVAFHSSLAKARRTGDIDAYAEAVALYGGDLLPEDDDPWTDSFRTDLTADFSAALGEYGSALEGAGLIDDAVRVGRMLVGRDPLNEDAHVRLMRALALAGRRPDALRQFEALRARLGAELGIEPGPQAQHLAAQIKARRVSEPEHDASLWERIGELRLGSGDARGAVRAYEAALRLADAPPQAARSHRLVAAAYLGAHRVESADAHLVRAEALGADPAERGRLVCLRAEQSWLQGDLDRAALLAQRAAELAGEHGTVEDQARAEEALAFVSHLRGDWRRGLEIEIARSGERLDADTFTRAFDVHQCVGQFHLYSDELSPGVEQYARQLLAQSTDAGILRLQAFSWCLLGESLLLRAHWDEAAGCLHHSADLYASLGPVSGALPWQRLAELAACRKDFDEVGPALRKASAIATVSPTARHLWGRIHATAAFARLQQGLPEAAARSVRAAAAAAARGGDCPSCSALLHPVAAQTYALLGRADLAGEHAAAAAAVADGFGGSAWRAMAQSAAGSAAAAGGDAGAARTQFEEAAHSYLRAGHAYWAEYAQRQAFELADLAGVG